MSSSGDFNDFELPHMLGVMSLEKNTSERHPGEEGLFPNLQGPLSLEQNPSLTLSPSHGTSEVGPTQYKLEGSIVESRRTEGSR